MRRKRKQRMNKNVEFSRTGERRMGTSDHQILQDFNFSMNLKALIAEIKDSER
jgi:hypothetical protein